MDRRRLEALRATVDQMLVIFPFEVALLQEKEYLLTVILGNPLVEQVQRLKASPREFVPWGIGKRIALLPGNVSKRSNKFCPY